jgi:hypothetical protein
MSKESNQALMQTAVNTFSKVTKELYDSHAYSSGYFESSLLMLFAELPARKQQMYLEMMQRSLKQKIYELSEENSRKQVALTLVKQVA